MASYDIIGGIVDPKALAELQNLEKIANNIAVKLRGVTLGSMSKEADAALVQRLNAETAKLVAQEQKLQGQIQRTNQARAAKIKLTTEEKVSQSALNNIAKLSAILSNEYTTALQKLDAQIKLNIIDAQKYVQAGDTQNPMYLQNIANTKKLSQEYDRLAKASGATMQKTSSMYGATFSLTQVMRELPNFAIDARIGFMALSNNLPMLAENFSRVKHEIDAITGKEKGFKGAFKEFGKSLLSLNTIMIIVSTVLVLFGDDIVKLINKTFKGVDAIDKLSDSQRALMKVLEEQSGITKTNTTKILELGVAINKYKQGTGDSKKIVEQYNETLGVHYGKLNDINAVMQAYPKYAEEYIKWSIKMAAAMLQVDEAAKLTLNLQKIDETIRSSYSADNIKKVEQYNNALKNIYSDNWSGKADANATKSKILTLQQSISEIQNLNEINKLLSERITTQEKLNKILKSAEELYPGDFSNKEIKNVTTIVKDVQTKIESLKPIDLTTLLFPVSDPNKPNIPQFGDFITQSMNSQLNSLNEQYDAGIIGYKDYLEKRMALTTVAGEAGIEIQDSINQKMADIDADHYEEMLQYKAEMAQMTVDILESIWSGFYERYIDKLEETAEKEKRIEDERLSDIDDREKAGVITKQQAEEEKLRIEAYSMSVQDELDRQKEETERKQFILEQAAAIARIWVDFATASGSLENLLAHGAFTPLYLGIALASTGLAAAQAIPYFKDGVESSPEGLAVLGDGYKHELAITPSGQYFISDNKPTMYNLEKGTQILPDINRMDLASVLALRQVMPEMKENVEIINELKKVTSAVKQQKHGNFYGMPLIKQIENRNKFSSRSKSLMN